MDEWWKAVPDVLVGGWTVLAGPRDVLAGIKDNSENYGAMGCETVCWGAGEVRAKFMVSLHNAVITDKIVPDDDLLREWYT